MAERPTFSPFWHRVRAMCPRLRPHVQISRQHYRGRRWHVVHDPTTNNFYRLNPIAHEFVGMLDGKRTIEEVWKISLERHGDSAPTQNEVIQLLSQLYQSNLLSVDATPETEQLLRRGRERIKKKAQSQAIGIMYFRIKVFNPDRYISWIEPILRPILNKWGFLAWLAFIIFGLINIIPYFGELTDPALSGSVISPSNWGWLIVVFIVTKAIHETGHGVICKRFQGQVPEFGFMLLVLFPAPYVDASQAWSFDSKWKRAAVGAGGMIFELFVATIASFVWIATREGSSPLVHQIAYNVIFTASISTIIFNANPLMRFDGYYILSDLLEVPNLMQRSLNQLKYFFQKYIYRIEQARPPSTQPGETAILYTYGLGALAYRIFLFFSITLLVMGKLFALGLILAIWTGVMWFILPVGKFVHWLASSPQLADFRPRAVITSLAMIAAGVLAVGAIPVHDYRRASGVVQSDDRSGVFFAVDGFVTEAHAGPGDMLSAGDPIVTCESPELNQQLQLAQARLLEAETMARDAATRNPAAAEVAFERVSAIRRQARFYEDQIERLVVRAPHDGVLVGNDPKQVVGAFVRDGEQLCEVIDTRNVRIAAVMNTVTAGPVFELGSEVGSDKFPVQIRRYADPGVTRRGSVEKLTPAGSRDVPAPLTYAGGGDIEIEQSQDQSGPRAKNPHFIAYILPVNPDDDEPWLNANGEPVQIRPGERVSIRFRLEDKPLAAQWIDRLWRMVQGRVNI